MYPYRTVLLACAVSVLPVLACAQQWSYTSAVQRNIPVYEMRTDNALVYRAPREDELSEWQPLPFPWMFGDRPVTGYYISDNGYITFDTLARYSVPENGRPDSGKVRDALFAFWDDFFLEEGHGVYSNEVRTRTAGTPPNRDHVVMWIAVTPHGMRWSPSNTASFALVLHEAGGFDVVHVAGSTSRPLTGSVGLQGREDSERVLVDGSAALPFPPVTANPDDDVNYFFTYGTTSTVSEVSPDRASLDFDLHPNPASDAVTVRVGTTRRERFTLRIFDVLGREAVPESTMDTRQNGTIHIPLRTLRPGAYIMQLRSGSATAVRSLHVVR